MQGGNETEYTADTWWQHKVEKDTEEYEANLGVDKPEDGTIFYENPDAGTIRYSMLDGRVQ